MTITENLDADFKDFTDSVFTGAGEQQLSDLNMIWYAAIFCATQQVAKTGDLTGVHVAAFDKLKIHNEFALAQVKGRY